MIGLYSDLSLFCFCFAFYFYFILFFLVLFWEIISSYSEQISWEKNISLVRLYLHFLSLSFWMTWLDQQTEFACFGFKYVAHAKWKYSNKKPTHYLHLFHHILLLHYHLLYCNLHCCNYFDPGYYIHLDFGYSHPDPGYNYLDSDCNHLESGCNHLESGYNLPGLGYILDFDCNRLDSDCNHFVADCNHLVPAHNCFDSDHNFGCIQFAHMLLMQEAVGFVAAAAAAAAVAAEVVDSPLWKFRGWQ